MKSVSEQIFQALGSSSDPKKQCEALLEVNNKIVSEFFSFSTGNGACQTREINNAAHIQSGGDNDAQ